MCIRDRAWASVWHVGWNLDLPIVYPSERAVCPKGRTNAMISECGPVPSTADMTTAGIIHAKALSICMFNIMIILNNILKHFSKICKIKIPREYSQNNSSMEGGREIKVTFDI